MINAFLHSVKKFTKTMEATVASVKEIVKLPLPEPRHRHPDDPQTIMELAQQPETVRYFEGQHTLPPLPSRVGVCGTSPQHLTLLQI